MIRQCIVQHRFLVIVTESDDCYVLFDQQKSIKKDRFEKHSIDMVFIDPMPYLSAITVDGDVITDGK